MNDFWPIIITSIILGIGLIQGLSLGKKVSWTMYSKGPQNLGFLRSWFSLVVSLIGSFMVFGIIQMSFEGGITPLLLGLSYPLSLFLLIPLLNKMSKHKTANNGYLGIDNILAMNFGKGTLLVFWIAQLLAFFGILSGQFLAIGTYLKIFHGIEQQFLAILLAAIAPVLYTTVSGLHGVVKNDVIQGFFVLSFILVLGVPLFFSNNTQYISIPASNNLFGSYNLLFPLFGFVFLIPTLASRADVWQRIQICVPEKRKKTIFFTFLTIFIFYFVLTLIGWIALGMKNNNLLTISNSNDVFLMLVNIFIQNDFYRVILMASILSALISSIDSYLIISSLALINIFPKNNTDVTSTKEKSLLSASRLATVIIAFFSSILAFVFPNIVDLLVASFSIIIVCSPIVLLSIFSKGKYKDWYGVVTIGSGIFAWLMSIPFLNKLAFLPGIFISLLSLVVFYKFSKIIDTNEENRS
jgi:Na+/proline symporter